VEARNDRIRRGVVHVDVSNINHVVAHTPMKYDGKVQINSLGKTSMIGFVRIQLMHRTMAYLETDGIKVLQGKLQEWVKKDKLDHLVPIESLTKQENQQIQVLLDNGCEKDTEGNGWTIEKRRRTTTFEIIQNQIDGDSSNSGHVYKR